MTGFAKRTHGMAQDDCRRRHGDGRYDPGSYWHRLRWWLPAVVRYVTRRLRERKP